MSSGNTANWRIGLTSLLVGLQPEGVAEVSVYPSAQLSVNSCKQLQMHLKHTICSV
mgnify:FL=1